MNREMIACRKFRSFPILIGKAYVFYLCMFDDFCACLDSHVLFCVRELPEAIENFLWHLVRRRGGHDRHLGEGDGLQTSTLFQVHNTSTCVLYFDLVALLKHGFIF